MLHSPTVGFAAHHATTITSCKAGDAKRKGKVERPFRQLRETFMPEVEADGIPADLAELNLRAQGLGALDVMANREQLIKTVLGTLSRLDETSPEPDR